MGPKPRRVARALRQEKGTLRRKYATAAKQAPGHLFQNWEVIQRRLRAASRLALFLDFDGTLAPLRSHPEDVRFPPATRQALRRLAWHPRVRAFIISGRRMPDVRRHVGLPRVTCLGLHGWETRRRRPESVGLHRFMERLRREVESKFAGAEGVWVEDKYVGFVVHSRYAPQHERKAARAALDKSLAPVASRVRVLKGKNVWEVLPVEVRGKGAAVKRILEGLGPGVLPLYVGDDLSDEAAFEALPRGVTVRVGRRGKTSARYWLRDPEEVREFLERLEEEIS
ncbi:MAG TPA: trehalose-phosphatase [Terriglobia bacterium]|nr:trehalose-phosphatase [Terriglobia bacterium]